MTTAVLIAALLNKLMAWPLVTIWLLGLLNDLYAVVGILIFKRQYAPRWWLALEHVLPLMEGHYLRWAALPFIGTVPCSFVWDIQRHSIMGTLADIILTWLFWRAWKNRPRKKRKPNKVLGVIRERAGRLVVVPQPT